MGQAKEVRQKVLVTGGAGFLGSHLCDRLLKDSSIEHVWCIDNLQTGSTANIKQFIENPRFSFIEHDIVDPFNFNFSPDCIFNLACAASPPLYQKDPIHTFKTCVIGTDNVIALALEADATVIQASTSEVYGDPAVPLQSETYWGNVNPVGIRSCYDEGKRAAETLLFDYSRQHRLKQRTVRIFNTYGPKMSPQDGRVVSNFVVQALANECLTVYGDGSQTRSFCFVDDLIDGLISVAKLDPSVQGPINLGNPHEFTILELAKAVIELTGTKSELKFVDLPSDDPKQRCPDISLARRLMGWEPKIPFRDGLSKTIEYFRDDSN